MRLKDKIAIVTGGASGIGKAISDLFAAEGAAVILADKNEDAIPEAIESIKQAGGRASGSAVDVTQRDQLAEFMDKVVAQYGRIDILINNAGVSRYRPFATTTSEDWDIVLDVDLKGVFFCTQAVAPHMVRQNYGRVVNISSALGTGAAPHKTAGSPGGSAAYASAKAGVIMLTKTLARELGPSGVTVNCVAPGSFLTPFSASTRTPEEVQEHMQHRKNTVVLGRLGTLQELAAPVLFLASDDSSYVTGQTLFVDGGRSDRM
ncbi:MULTISPECIES: 3-oxoacyl-ACP reductase family protein [unclassified Mesorhizobium]|uniref:SDR family NAD(P)-dependent oxidoreductase n=1 Tax=unclassified Mesorhizobium TaxID=325217 RepID=UPI000FD9D10F|nr:MULTISPECIES: 3-oxoacyl-ACP reductase family protein [unclassified Mesorhizobium]TGR18828.1 3-oxoacyl-ACP reductase FabG [Mesorhizobium sp. M8A.F.Ca.ET.197.01.1.1]TGR37094.1 3-oxoacyl-ACP reductase FabG [bacterium M00.F.Ca.ET.199.01.1.1]TGR41569.1 3-oxoacyl-ACP reductase FabG [Mesorhizobium sp. M8A.F.Ca.ET.198.01.1.1]TGV85279.1 3-oxoacyl-ACP reductase FabG [Mesorhizobium sp. M00.F.Ca.ET.149.01.1.1]